MEDAYYSFERENGANDVLVGLNNAWSTRTVTITNLDHFSNGQVLHDELTGNAYTVSGNSVTLTLNSNQAVELTNRY